MSSKISDISIESGAATSIAASVPEGSKGSYQLLSWALVAAGASLIAASLLHPAFRDGRGVLTGTFCLPLAAGLSVIVTGAAVGTVWARCAAWLGLVLVGQAASLQMIDAGRLIHFQHYRSVPELFGGETISLSILALQTVAVSLGISTRFGTVKNWFRENFAWWQLLLAALFIVFSSAAVTPDLSIYGTSLGLGSIVQFVNIANVVLLAWAVPRGALPYLSKRTDRFLGGIASGIETQNRRVDKFAVVAAFFMVVLTAALSYFVYEAHPHVPDEAQYIFQANYMAAGQLTVDAPLVPEAFSMYMVPWQEARWFGIFPPGWPAILAVGTLAGASWLVNPILAGICVLLAYVFFQQLYSRRFARLGVLFLCCSPWFIFMSMSYMSHVATLTFALAAAVLLHRALQTHRWVPALSSGVAIGAVALIRPLDGVLVAFILGIWCLLYRSPLKQRSIILAFLIAGTTSTAALILPYNRMVTGEAGLMPIDFYYSKYFGNMANAMGFGAGRGLGWGLDAFPGHSPLEAVVNSAVNTFSLNTELLGWSTGSLFLILLYTFSATRRAKELWCFAVIALVCGAYGFYWYHGGPDFGARYWFLCIIPLIVLTVKGVEWVSSTVARESSSTNVSEPRVYLAAALLCAVTMTVYVPWRAADKYFRYLGTRPGLQEFSKQFAGRNLVLIRGSELADYQSAWIMNPINFDGDQTIYAFDGGPDVRVSLAKNYSDRRLWIVAGPTLTGRDYLIEQGPIDPSRLLTGDR